MEPEYVEGVRKDFRKDDASAPSPEKSNLAASDATALQFSSEPERLPWLFFGPQGLRAGWLTVIFAFLLFLLAPVFGTILSILVFDVAHLSVEARTPLSSIFGEGEWLSALAIAGIVVALFEQRRLADYNLGGPHRLRLFAGGLIAGFAALSTLMGILVKGGWMQLGPVSLGGPAIFKYALLWGTAFVMVALFEEGAFRCYLLSTFARSMNFWWALLVVGAICIYLLLASSSRGAWGIYAVALLGLLPCLWLHLKDAPGNAFWQAAWATSAGFGFIHTFNNGENWIGILGAATIGFVFCVSVRVTGSAWWAIGCHASWDWAESYFYGTADSGFAAKGHYLTAVPVGSSLWSGGADGPEGSLLMLPVALLLLLAVIVLYRKRMPARLNEVSTAPLAS
ncbi:MAG TPA: CPBP family intramembrane glutamic endopeptidase [Terracidiphilus sp.]|jgi:hypothetical protein